MYFGRRLWVVVAFLAVLGSARLARAEHISCPGLLAGSPAALKGKKVVVLIDAYSSGIFLAPYLQDLGFGVIHFTSHPDMPANYGITEDNEYWNEGHDLGLSWLGKESLDFLAQFDIVGSIGPTDAGYAISDEVAHHFNLPMNDYALTAARGEKDLANAVLAANGIPVAKQTFGTLDQIKPWIEALNRFPVWVKPRKGTGNDGVSECHDMDAVAAAYSTITSHPTQLGVTNQGVLVEEDLPGEEYICDFAYRDGEWVLAHISQYEKVPKFRPDGTQTLVYKRTRVSEGDGEIQRILTAYGASILKPLGALSGMSHLEIKITPLGPRLVEHNPRMVGAKFTKLINIATGFGPMELLVEALLFPEKFKARVGKPPYKLLKHASLIHLNSDHSGKILATPYLEQLRKHPAWQYDFINGEGDDLLNTIDVDSSPGIFYVAHEDPAVVDGFENLVLELMAKDAFFVYEPDRMERVRRALATLPDGKRQEATRELQRLHRSKDEAALERFEDQLL